jgi:hypothetical protein
MSPESAIYLLIYIAIIVVIAWVLTYIADQMMAPAPRPVHLVIWGIAFLLVLLLLLRNTGLLHASGLMLQ